MDMKKQINLCLFMSMKTNGSWMYMPLGKMPTGEEDKEK
jgi:hypothetical protein